MNSVRTLLLLLLATTPLAAQESAAYVSRLTAQAGPTSVLITWKDAEGWPGVKYEVWRSDKEIVKDSLSAAKLIATVDAGVEAYEDKTVVDPSFYLVLLKDSSGTRRSFFIPYRNKTLTAVKPDGAAATSTARVKLGTVSYANPQILVSFSAYPPDRKLAVYRKASPIATLADLKDSTLLGNTTGAQTPYRDTPPAGLEFYYAIVDAQAFADGKADAFQIDNATDHPVGFPLVAIPNSVKDSDLDASLRPLLANTARALPLPRLQVEAAPESGSPLAQPAYHPIEPEDLPPASAQALKAWSKATKPAPPPLPEPVILPEERSATPTGAAQYLVQIRKAHLEPKDWAGAVTALEAVLKLTLEPKVEARARYYLGMALASQKNYRPAFLEFTTARVWYPAECKPYIEALFSLLRESKD